jgi:pimeloyl-ACP methyl ester carboxylesterase
VPFAFAVLTFLMPVAPVRAQTPPPLPVADNGTQFLVFFRSQPVGREEVLVLQMGDGWIVRGTSRLGQPIDITTRVAQVDYDLQWQPKSLIIDGIVRGQDLMLKTTFAGGKASNVIAVQGSPQSKIDDVSADPVVLPNAFLGSYAALARRLQGKTTGSELRGYIAPQAEVTIRVTAAVPERIETPKGVITATRYALTFNNPPPLGDLAINLWADAQGGLLRMNIPSQMVEMAREDIASAATRTSSFSVPGDESVTIPSLGFSLAATITRPANVASAPAVVLVGGSGPTDRDETVAGIPIFGHLARDLAAAGFAVVRYDKRGIGQSGGRAESVTIADYAEDVRSILFWLQRQKGIDKDRIALVGHSEGGLVSMLTAGRERDRVAALVLVGTPSTSGNDVVLEQQKRMLSQMPIDEAQRKEKIELQEQINQAVIKGTGWGDIPVPARRAADTPWFYSFLTFDPAKAMDRTRQPVLIVQGGLDTQVLPHHADALAALARDRDRKRSKAPVEVVKVEGVNHLLVPAKTGEVSEYATLGADAKVSSEVTGAIASFLTKVLKG